MVVVVVVCCKGSKVWLLWWLLWLVWERSERWVVVENGGNMGRRLGLWAMRKVSASVISTGERGGSGINGSVDGSKRKVN